MKKQGFIHTLLSICSGTSIFPEIAKFSFMRMVFHLFLLAILASMVNVAFRYHPFSLGFETCCARVQKKFGDIEYSKKGIRPSINPDKTATVYYEDMRIDYFPEIEQLKDFKPRNDDLFGIAWTPVSVVSWVSFDNKVVPMAPLLYLRHDEGIQSNAKKSVMDLQRIYSIDSSQSLYEYSKIVQIDPSLLSPDKKHARDFSINITEWSLKIPIYFLILVTEVVFLNCFLFSSFYILIFTLFSFFLGKSNMLSCKFSQLFIIGIYTGFPGIVIASLFTAVARPYFPLPYSGFPYLDFQSVFLISYLLYSFPVFGRLRLAQIQQEKEKAESK